MCDRCTAYDNETDEWEGIPCECACAEEDLNPSEVLEDGSQGTICSECKHIVG